jgi:precorrin-3B methylase
MDENRLSGSLVCVGLGMTLGSHLGPLARSHIEQADVVSAGVSDGMVELWLQRMHKDVRSLQPYYQEGKSRMQTYRQIVEAMLTEVRAGRKVCGVCYGRPGVFAWAPRVRAASQACSLRGQSGRRALQRQLIPPTGAFQCA